MVVIDAPDYIHTDLIHALPDPKLSEHLGGVAQVQKVRPSDTPTAGHCWYVRQDVRGVGSRLRLWKWSFWPDREKMTGADW